jgi:hypothetical protein
MLDAAIAEEFPGMIGNGGPRDGLAVSGKAVFWLHSIFQ